jgi:hypothetical protein
MGVTVSSDQDAVNAASIAGGNRWTEAQIRGGSACGGILPYLNTIAALAPSSGSSKGVQPGLLLCAYCGKLRLPLALLQPCSNIFN